MCFGFFIYNKYVIFDYLKNMYFIYHMNGYLVELLTIMVTL